MLTVGTFHAGTKNNIIPDDATLGLTLRSYDSKVMKNMIAAVRRTAEQRGYGLRCCAGSHAHDHDS